MEGPADGTPLGRTVDPRPSPPASPPPSPASPLPAAAPALPDGPADPSPPPPAAPPVDAPSREAAATSQASTAPEPVRKLAKHDTLRDRIVEHLRRTGTDSISGITRVLAQGGGAPAHRLTVAGYLQALTDAGVIREMDRPPSKLYQLQNPEAHWSLHQRIHRLLQDTAHSEGDAVRIALAALQTALHRPIFQAELLHAGFASVPDDLRRVVVGDGTRRTYRELFTHRASPHIPIPPRDPLLALDDGDPLLASDTVAEVLRRVLAKATGADHLVAEAPAGPQQAQLDLGGAA